MQYNQNQKFCIKIFLFLYVIQISFLNQRYTVLPKGPSHMVSLAYSKLGIFLAESNLFHSCHFEKASANFIPRQNHSFGGEVSGHGSPFPTAFVHLNLDIEKNSSKRSNFQQYYANVFFDPVQGEKNKKIYNLWFFVWKNCRIFYLFFRE